MDFVMGERWLCVFRLLLLLQIASTFADTQYGYLQQSMTIHCPGYEGAPSGILHLIWKKCATMGSSCEDVGSMIIINQLPTVRMQGDLQGRGDMSAPDGRLTIFNLRFEDAATYRCEFPDHSPRELDLLVYEKPSIPEINGVAEPIVVGNQPEVVCHVARAKPSNLTIQWSIADDPKVLNGKLTVNPEDDNGVVAAYSQLLYNFTRDDNRRTLRCDVIPGVDSELNRRSNGATLSLQYPFITKVQETSSSTLPLEGQSKMLTCHQVHPGSPNHVDGYVWLHDGEVIDESDDNYSGLDEKRMKIKVLDRGKHNGQYQCLIQNSAGDTKFSGAEGYPLKVWYAPEVTFEDIHPTDRVIDDTKVTLTCHADSVPASKNFTWLRETTVVRGPTESEYNSTYHRRMSYNDGGNYTCRVCNIVMCVSHTRHLEVFFPPNGSPGLSAGPPQQVIGENVTLTCYSSDLTVRGNPFPTWTVWSKDDNRTFTLNLTGVTWTFTASSVRESGGYRCAMGNQYSYGSPTDLSRSERVEILTPLVPEAPTSNALDRPTYDNDFSLTCVFSGTNIRTIVWMKDNVEVDHLLFEIVQTDVSGHYSFDQTSAQQSTLRRRPVDQYSCRNVAAFSGSFHCVAQSDNAGEVSPTMEVHVKYPPFWNGHPSMIESSQTGDHNKQVRCNVCAYPTVSLVTWTDIHGGTLRHGIVISNDTIVIDTVRIEDFTVYRCQVQNELSAKEFEITLEEKGPPHQVTDLTIVNVTSTVVTLAWIPGYHAGFPPLAFSIRYRLRDAVTVEWKYCKNISENPSSRTVTWQVPGLAPNSNYTFQVQANNSRPSFEGPSTSMWVSRDASTSQPLNVTIDRVSIMDNGRLEIMWLWNQSNRRKRSVAATDVSIRANYSIDGGVVWYLYPEDEGVPVTEGKMTVYGDFKQDMDVLVKLAVYEFSMLVVVVDAPPTAYGKPAEGIDPVIIGAAVGVLVAVLLLLTLLTLILMRRRQGKTKEGDARRNGHAAPIMQRPGNQYERVLEDSSAENSQNDLQDVHYEPMRTCLHPGQHVHGNAHIPMEATHPLYAKPCKIHQRRPPEHHYHEVQAPSIPERGYQCEHHHHTAPYRDSGYEMDMENPYAEVDSRYQKLGNPYTELRKETAAATLPNPHAVTATDGGGGGSGTMTTMSPPMMRPMSKPPTAVENYTYAEVKKPPRLLPRGEADGASGDQMKENGTTPKLDYTYAEVKKPKKQGPPKPQRTFSNRALTQGPPKPKRSFAVVTEDIPPSDVEDPPSENLYAEIDTEEPENPSLENPYSNLPATLPPENPYANMPDPSGNPPECPYGNMEEIEKQQFEKIMGDDGVMYADLDFRDRGDRRSVGPPPEKYDKTEYASINFLGKKKALASNNESAL